MAALGPAWLGGPAVEPAGTALLALLLLSFGSLPWALLLAPAAVLEVRRALAVCRTAQRRGGTQGGRKVQILALAATF